MLSWEAIETVITKTEGPHLLFSFPGTGKSTYLHRLASKLSGENYQNITVHSDLSAQEFIGFDAIQSGDTVFKYGPASIAWRTGTPLIIDEVNNASGSVVSMLLGILDDVSIARLTLMNGETIKPKKGFVAWCTMNGLPEDLPQNLRDRFRSRIFVQGPHPDALKTLPDGLRTFAENVYSTVDLDTPPKVSFRDLKHFHMMESKIHDREISACAVWGERYSEILASIDSANGKK